MSPADGSLSLQQILIPIAHSPSSLSAIEYAVRAVYIAGQEVKITLLQVGDSHDMPKVQLRKESLITWETLCRSGNVVEQIVRTAEELSADLVDMSTAGHDGFLDAIRGSVTERVRRRMFCPLLAISATSK